MRLASPLCVLVCALSLSTTANAVLGIEEAPAERPAVEVRNFQEVGSGRYEKERASRLQEQRRSIVERRARGIAIIAGPVMLLFLVAFLVAKARSGNGRRSTHRKLKHAEMRRRAGGPQQMLDPREW